MKCFFLALLVATLPLCGSLCQAAEKLRVLIIDGQNNHNWKETTPLLRRFLEESGRFTVDVATSPPSGDDMAPFKPTFGDYDVVVSNYNGDRWSGKTESLFRSYVSEGGGFVTVHAADNAFPNWPEYNQMIGLGGWRGRDESSGPYVYYSGDNKIVDDSPGQGGSHGKQHEFLIQVREPNHPIMRGIPSEWMHTKDELYAQLRGPARSMEILATSFSDPNQGGTGRDEPMLMTIQYDKGRVFHTVLGHADYSMKCAGFVTTFLRGTEWAATGVVTIPVPDNFPSAEKAIAIE